MQQNQKGRSMIEMLGVLAIVGVLSVMGILGYTKAMLKMRVNKTVHQITQITNNTRMAFGSQRDYSGMGVGDQVNTVMYTAELAPKEMLATNDDGTIIKPYSYKNIFKGNVTMRYADNSTANDKSAFIIRYDGLPKTACIEVASKDWGGTNGLGFVGMTINQSMPNDLLDGKCKPTSANSVGKAIFCTRSGMMPAATATRACKEPKNNFIEFKFY